MHAPPLSIRLVVLTYQYMLKTHQKIDFDRINRMVEAILNDLSSDFKQYAGWNLPIKELKERCLKILVANHKKLTITPLTLRIINSVLHHERFKKLQKDEISPIKKYLYYGVNVVAGTILINRVLSILNVGETEQDSDPNYFLLHEYFKTKLMLV